MKTKTKLLLVVVIVAVAAALVFWLGAGGRDLRAAQADERVNQERLQTELPRPNESAPRGRGGESMPR